MKHPGVMLVALLATVGICAQNAGLALGVGWGMIHGAGLGIVVAFVPVTLGLATLWAVYLFLSRRPMRGAPAIFTVCALGLLLLNEMLLSMTPLRAWKGRRNIDAIDVYNIRDEVFLSARGNPIGIRLTFEVRFPVTVAANVSASVFAPVAGQAPGPLQLARRYQESIEPSPASERGYHVFRKDTVYRFDETALPNFLSYDERTQEPCLMAVETTVSEGQFLDMLSSTHPKKYQTAILVGSDSASTNQLLQTYVTKREYDVKSMYETIVREGNRGCDPANRRAAGCSKPRKDHRSLIVGFCLDGLRPEPDATYGYFPSVSRSLTPGQGRQPFLPRSLLWRPRSRIPREALRLYALSGTLLSTTICRIRLDLKVAPSGYYDWLQQPMSNRAQEDARLMRLIRASFVASHSIYGALVSSSTCGRPERHAASIASHD